MLHARPWVAPMGTIATLTNASSDYRGPSGRRRRRTRYVPVALGLLLVIGILGGLKCAQISTLKAAGSRAQKAGPPPETVNTTAAEEQNWDQTLDTVGSVTAARGALISNFTPGPRSGITFKPGPTAAAGR